MKTAHFLRDRLKSLKTPDGTPKFEIVDCGDECLPVVGARLNPELGRNYDDIDFQHALAERYVCKSIAQQISCHVI